MESHLNLPSATGPDAPIANDAVNNSAQFNHLPYNLMITAAIVAMKERGGSSRQAIAKYIEREYKNFSLSHATLLTRQLRFCYDKEEAWSSSQDPVQWRWGGGVAFQVIDHDKNVQGKISTTYLTYSFSKYQNETLFAEIELMQKREIELQHVNMYLRAKIAENERVQQHMGLMPGGGSSHHAPDLHPSYNHDARNFLLVKLIADWATKLGEANPDLNLDIGEFCATISSDQDDNGTPMTQGDTTS